MWVFGSNTAITEGSPFNAPAMVAWKEPIERRLLDATGMRGIVLVSSVAYGDGGGAVPGLLLGSPRDGDGNLIMLGTGRQHWSTVHVADLAVAFRLVMEDDTARGYYVIGNGLNPTVAELTEAAAVPPAPPERRPVPKKRRVPGSATTLPRCCCSTKGQYPSAPASSLAGSQRTRVFPTSSVAAATQADSALASPFRRPVSGC